jgi:peptide/nickel transport system substrate-binding protein
MELATGAVEKNWGWATLADYERETGNRITSFNEAPILAALVASGDLPPVEDRLPDEPLVDEPFEQVGTYGGTLRLGMVSGTTYYPASIYQVDFTLGLNRVGEEIVPNIAKGFEFSPDNTTMTLSLREGMKWSDGAPFTSNDFVWQYENVSINEDLNPTPPLFLRIGSEVGAISKVDDTTVKFTFPIPNFLFLEIVAQADEACYSANSWRNVTYAPAHYMQQFHIDFNSDANAMAEDAGYPDWTGLYDVKGQVNLNPEKPVISPWRLTNTLTEQVVTAERNPYFWAVDPAGNQLPYLDGIQLTLVEGGTDLGTLKALQGEIDMQGRHIQLDQFPTLKQGETDGDYTVKIWPTFAGSDIAFFLNMSLPGGTGDAIRTLQFRQALSSAIDRKTIQEIQFLGLGEIRQGVPPPAHPHYPGDDIAYLRTEYDPEGANTLLDQVFPNKDGEGWRLDANGDRIVMGISVTDAFGTWPDAAQVVGRAWEAVGVKTDVNQTTRTLHSTRWQTNQWAVAVWTEDTAGFTFSSIGKRAPIGIGSLHGPGCAQWLENPDGENAYPCAQESIDLLQMHKLGPGLPPAERNALGKEIYKTIVENQYNIGIVGRSPMVQGVIVVKNGLKNVPDTAGNDWPLRTPNTGFPEQWFYSSQ